MIFYFVKFLGIRFSIRSSSVDGTKRYVAMQHNHGRLGNQIFYFCTGYVIAKRLGRTLYVPYSQSEERDFNVMRRMRWTTEIFPRLKPLYTIFEQTTINQTVVPLAYNTTNQPACCLYEDPIKLVNNLNN
ncbi:hypothetical protein Y032_0008g293 [Ancylostoma ceylanicum]|nr:hypothetical protein Y032_0008g293 [Ancylostoma ceylanicum]